MQFFCSRAAIAFYVFALTGRVFKTGIKSEAVLGYSIRCFSYPVKRKNANGLKH